MPDLIATQSVARRAARTPHRWVAGVFTTGLRLVEVSHFDVPIEHTFVSHRGYATIGTGLCTWWRETRAARDIDLVAPLAQDLAQLRLLCGRPPGNGLIFPTLDGDEWKRYDWQNWRRRVHRPAGIAAGVTGELRRYRLRGSFVSLRLGEGRSLTYVAEQAGHSVATLTRHYAGVLRELEHAGC